MYLENEEFRLGTLIFIGPDIFEACICSLEVQCICVSNCIGIDSFP